MDMKKLFLVFAILSLSLVQFSGLVHAQDDITEAISEGAEWVLGTALGFPDEWLTVNGFIFNFFVPFIGAWAIVLGFLRVIGIFETESRLELIISFAMVFSTLPIGWFVIWVQWMFGYGAIFATVAFVALFILGTSMHSLVKGRGFWGGAGWGRGGVFSSDNKGTNTKIRNLDRKIKQLKLKIKNKKEKVPPEDTLNDEEELIELRYKLKGLKVSRDWITSS